MRSSNGYFPSYELKSHKLTSKGNGNGDDNGGNDDGNGGENQGAGPKTDDNHTDGPETSRPGLPSDLQTTLDRIANGEKFPHRNDGSVYQNRNGKLPDQPRGYYHEYVHPTPGVSGPGQQSVVIGGGGETYYTPDHYNTFIRVK
jgi:guanyl-specific ribonuclease Sa